MSFSLAKKNIKHKRKTMKRKQEGGILEYINPFRRKPKEAKVEFDGVGDIEEEKKAEYAGTVVIKSRMQNSIYDKPVEPHSASTSVTTVAATNQQSTCNTTYESIKKKLEAKNIKSISKNETKRLTTLDTVTFDNVASAVEKGEAFVKMVKNISFAMETIKSALPPGTTGIIGIAESLGVAASKYNKQLELVYLSAQCLIYVSNISHDLAEIHSFYNNEHVKGKNITIDQSLYESLVKSIFTFTYFLIDNIDFESKISSIDQFKFWYSFLSRIDFSKTKETNETNETKKGYIYKYSCKECIPQKLREKLQFISIYDKNYEKIINFDYVFDTSKSKTKKKSRLARLGLDKLDKITDKITSKVSELSSAVSSGESVLSSAASKAGRKMGITSKGLFGFCSDEIVEQCKNYNDIIMRLIEFNIYKLFRNTYRNQNSLPIDFERIGAGITSEVFYDYIFKDIYICN